MENRLRKFRGGTLKWRKAWEGGGTVFALVFEGPKLKLQCRYQSHGRERNKTDCQLASLSACQTANQPASLASRQPASQPGIHPSSQPASQPASQSSFSKACPHFGLSPQFTNGNMAAEKYCFHHVGMMDK